MAPSAGSALVHLGQAGSGDYEEDCQALTDLPVAWILLSKCQSAQETRRLADVLDRKSAAGEVRIHALIESSLPLES